MTLIANDELLEAWIQELKGNSTVTDLLDDVNEIRQEEWKGSGFTYPAIRVEILVNTPPNSGDSDQCLASQQVAIYTFSEEASSLEANQIAGIIADEYHKKSLNSQGIFFTKNKVTELIPAIAMSERVWRAQVNLTSTVRRST